MKTRRSPNRPRSTGTVYLGSFEAWSVCVSIAERERASPAMR
jgi:hypothetical protein